MRVYVFFCFFFCDSSSQPRLGRIRSRGKCWAAIRWSHCPEPSGRAVHGEVDGLNIGGQCGRRCVLLHHTHRPQRKPYPFVQAGAETSGTGAEAVKPDPGFSWEGHSERVGAGVGDESAEFCKVVRPLRILFVIRPVYRRLVVVVR